MVETINGDTTCMMKRQTTTTGLRWIALGLLMSCLHPQDGRAETNPAPDVVPAVQRWIGGEGTLSLNGAAVYVVEEGFQRAAELLVDDWRAMGFGALLIREGEAADSEAFIEIRRNPVPQGIEGMISEEAYVLEIGERGVVIRAETPEGAYYGTRTLLQMLAPADRKSPTLPRGGILDAPVTRLRMLMLDVGRKPYPVPVLKDYIRMMAWLRMNELHLHLSDQAFGGGYTGFRIECETFPGLTSKDLFYTKQEIRELQDFAKDRGITLTPEIDMPGHAKVFTDYWPDLLVPGSKPGYMDVTNPKTVERMKTLLDEMIPLFDAPDFHIGTDEYRVSGSKERILELHEAFRQFINTMNEHVRSHGKNTRIWSGFEHMKGTTEPDPSVIIDMWVTDDAKAQIEKGHKAINSNHGRTYIVPGARYYGVSNQGIYDNWWPWLVSKDEAKNPARDDPNFLGGKLHVWNDKGPTGYNMTEIALLTWPSLMSFSEKMWGTKGSLNYKTFVTRAGRVDNVPGVTVLDRLPSNKQGVVLNHPEEVILENASAQIDLPFAKTGRTDLEWPWTLSVEVFRAEDPEGREVILSSDLVEIYADYAFEDEVKEKNEAGEKVKKLVPRRGVGMVRASGSPGSSPADAFLSKETRSVYADPLPLGQWVKLTLVGTEKRVRLYVDGELAGERREQMPCPLARFGSSAEGESFVGKVRNLKVYDREVLP